MCFVLFFFTPISDYFNKNDNIIKRENLDNLVRSTNSLFIEYNKFLKWVDNFNNIARGNINPPKMGPVEDVDFRPNIVNLNDDISAEESALRDEVEYEEDVLNSFNFTKPTNGLVTDTFNALSQHYGIDIATNKLEAIFAVEGGEVFISGQNEEFGNFMIINHRENVMSIYMHADSFTKKRGERVEGGEIIGKTGNTGTLSNGTHLHFELKHNGSHINPKKYILF